MRKVSIKARNLVVGDVLVMGNRDRKIHNVVAHTHTRRGRRISKIYATIVDRNARGLEMVTFGSEVKVKIKRSNTLKSRPINDHRRIKVA
jgi:hypothetical protein